jgi:aspartate kinase
VALQVFNVFAENSLSIDMVATSEVSISLTLDQSQRNKLSKAVAVSQLAAIADVTEKSHVAIISLIANVERSSEVMAEVFGVMRSESIQVSCYCYCCCYTLMR